MKWVAAALVCVMLTAFIVPYAQQNGDQQLLNMSWIRTGVSSRGARVLQTGELSTLTAAVASATRAKVADGSASTNIYLRGVVIEKSAGGTGVVTVSTGTGTNCGTSTDVIVVFTNPLSTVIPLGILLTTGEDVCITTEGANTSARLLVN